MALFGGGETDRVVPLGLGGEGLLPNLYDLVAIFILVAGVFVLIAHGAHEMGAPLALESRR